MLRGSAETASFGGERTPTPYQNGAEGGGQVDCPRQNQKCDAWVGDQRPTRIEAFLGNDEVSEQNGAKPTRGRAYIVGELPIAFCQGEHVGANGNQANEWPLQYAVSYLRVQWHHAFVRPSIARAGGFPP
jgi:hypothetical protein